MYLYEFQGKELLKRYGIGVPRGLLLLKGGDWSGVEVPWEKVVVKVQVLQGGRGKRGGVRVVSKEDAIKVAKEMVESWRGAKGVLIEEYVEHEEEFYLSLVLDREERGILLILSKRGGVDVEEVAEDVVKMKVDPFLGPLPHTVREASRYFGYDVGRVLKGAYHLFVERDLTLLEINPLVLRGDRFVALDSKIIYDPSALHRSNLPENPEQYTPLELEGRRLGLAVVEMEGRCAVMANGAGLTMATLDYLSSQGITPRLFLDLSGTDDPERVRGGFHIAVKTSPEVILVNIFSGMTKADTVAEGIIRGMEEAEVEVPVIVRLHGTNYERGRRMLERRGIHVHESLPEAVEHLKRVLGGGG